jgi:transcriptional regulator with XRE-family HTH domain
MGATLTTQHLGSALRKARKARGLAGRELARQVGMDHANLWRIEEGRETSLVTYNEIAKALGLVIIIRFKKA